MLDRYTTGLQPTPSQHDFYVITLAPRFRDVVFHERVSDAVARLHHRAPVAAAPQRVHNGVFVLGEARGTEQSRGVLVRVMAAAVAAEPCLFLFFRTHRCFLLRPSGFPLLRYGVRVNLLPSLSTTEATIRGNMTKASPMTMILSASPLTFPQLMLSLSVEPDKPPVSGRSMVITTA